MEHDGTMYGVDLIRHSSQGVRGDFFQVLQSYTGANNSNSFFSSKLFDDEILTITDTQKWCFSKFCAARKQELQIKLESKHENITQTTIYDKRICFEA